MPSIVMVAKNLCMSMPYAQGDYLLLIVSKWIQYQIKLSPK